MTISKELLDERLKGCERPEDLLGDAGLMKELQIKLMERMLGAELTAHLGQEDGKDAPPSQPNRRNGTSAKRLKGRDGELPFPVPRSRLHRASGRHSLNFYAWKDRQVVAADLRLIYGAATADLAAAELDAFEEKWAGKYARIAPAWRRAWQEVIPFFAFDPAIRKIIYTTNAIESLNRVIRKSIKTRGSFSTEKAATKLIYLAIRNFARGGRNVREWFAARNHFAIMFEDRFSA